MNHISIDYVAAYRAASAARAEAMNDIASWIIRGLKAAAAKVFGLDARSKALASLRKMDARDLADIGLTRNDVELYALGGSLK
jgi:uncharacterized protein YjiS (DUF1127 family)